MANERKTQEQLLAEMEEARKKIKVGGDYTHFKHPGEKGYQVIDVAINEKTEGVCVIYKSAQTGMWWIRTLDNFLEEVEVDGKKVKRFEFVGQI